MNIDRNTKKSDREKGKSYVQERERKILRKGRTIEKFAMGGGVNPHRDRAVCTCPAKGKKGRTLTEGTERVGKKYA